jgi:hypothetical protein
VHEGIGRFDLHLYEQSGAAHHVHERHEHSEHCVHQREQTACSKIARCSDETIKSKALTRHDMTRKGAGRTSDNQSS